MTLISPDELHLADLPMPNINLVSVGNEGSRGFWGVAQSMLGTGASDAQVQQLAQKLMSSNPGVTSLRAGDVLNGPADAVSDQARATYSAMDRDYQQQRAAQAATNEATEPVPGSFSGDLEIARQNGVSMDDVAAARLVQRLRDEGSGPLKTVGMIAGYIANGADAGVVGIDYLAKSRAQDILSRAAPLQNSRMMAVALTDLDQAASLFKSPTGKAATELAEAAATYGKALKGIPVVGYAATATEGTIYVANTTADTRGKAVVAVGADIGLGVASMNVGAFVGAQAGAYLAPFTGGLSIPIGTAVGALLGLGTYAFLGSDNVRDYVIGQPKEQ